MILERTIGHNIRRLRHEAHLTQAHLANLAECEESLISSAEEGKSQMSANTISAIAKALSVPAYILMVSDTAVISI